MAVGSSLFRNYFLFGLAGALIGSAFLFPQTFASVILGWLGALFLCHAVNTSRRVMVGLFFSGLVLSVIGFYWLVETVHFFGGFNYPLAAIIFSLFCWYSALQFVLCGVISRFIGGGGYGGFPCFSLSWLIVESFMPRIFPWAIAHTQITWVWFSGLADIFGANVLSFIMLLWGEAVSLLVLGKPRAKRFISLLFVLSACLLSVGAWRSNAVLGALEKAASVRVALVQGNLDAKQKGDVNYLESNLERYRELSATAVDEGAELVFWPESVVNAWVPENLTSVVSTENELLPDKPVNLLYGGLSYAERSTAEVQAILAAVYGGVSREYIELIRFAYYNTAFGVDERGDVVGRYHKRVLMPFGEYIPFAREFPFLQSLSPQTGNFDSGKLSEPISFNLRLMGAEGVVEEQQVKVMPLICYEDLVSSLAREAVLKGANILANLTNDAWYGRTAAPFQHNLLAAWRAIETRRFLLRVTNTGYTAVIDPLGRTQGDLEIFSNDYLIADVKPLAVETIYARLGDLAPLLIIGAVSALLWASRKARP